jgi:serine/threonine-protein kinase
MRADPNRAKSIFLSAVEDHSPDHWEEYVTKECGDDNKLRRRVEILLGAHQRATQFTEHGAAVMNAAMPTVDQPIAEQPGTVLGPYELLEQIGEGGMGTVFMPQQNEPIKRKVALKIIKPGMDTQQIVTRFQAERQVLAMMDHPHIARVLDVGATENGRSYFVMELVQGVAITEYCDQQQLSPRERLELFILVCRAVQHAHQKGVIHRDIKPSNVMIATCDGQPVPKVIDFGIAKAIDQQMTEKTVLTQLGQFVGTPEYMSPEQAELNQLDIDTRSDIYSLGVLLYELLTGTTPFGNGTLKKVGFVEMRRIIREDEPPRPSARVSTLQAGSLSTISDRHQIDPRKLSRSYRGELGKRASEPLGGFVRGRGTSVQRRATR